MSPIENLLLKKRKPCTFAFFLVKCLSLKKEDNLMYQLVLVYDNGREESIFISDDIREVELRKQNHIRSITEGIAEIRDYTPINEKK